MSTELDVAKMMWGWGDSKSTRPGSSYGSQTSVRYGTVVAVNDDGTVTIKLDDTGELITLKTTTPLAVGDRVTIVVQGGQYMVYALDETIRQMEQQKNDLAQQIIDEGNAIKDEVDAEMEAWKEDHKLTDADITHQINESVSGATETWEGQLSSVENDIETNYALKTEVTQGIDGLKSEIEENYTTSEGVTNEINTAITQASGEIQSTVEQNVMNSVGDTFATKTELTQTEQDLTLTINQSVANGYATCNTAASVREKVATCDNPNFSYKEGFSLAVKFTYANTIDSPKLNVNGLGAKDIRLGNANLTVDYSWDAGDTVLFVYDGIYWRVADAAMKTAKTVESYFIADSTGLTVGQSGRPSAVKMNSNGRFQVLNNGTNVFDMYYDSNSGATIKADMWDKVTVITSSSSLMEINNMGLRFSSYYGGFTVGGVAAVENYYYDAGGTTGLVSFVLGGIIPDNIKRAVIYYHCNWNIYDYKSVCVEITNGQSIRVDLTSISTGTGPEQIAICVEPVTVSLSGQTMKISRGDAYRASISSSGAGFNANPSPSALFRIDGVGVCIGTNQNDH